MNEARMRDFKTILKRLSCILLISWSYGYLSMFRLFAAAPICFGSLHKNSGN